MQKVVLHNLQIHAGCACPFLGSACLLPLVGTLRLVSFHLLYFGIRKRESAAGSQLLTIFDGSLGSLHENRTIEVDILGCFWFAAQALVRLIAG